MDAIVSAAEGAVSGLDAERDVRPVKSLNAEDFPHLFVYDAGETVERLRLQQSAATVLIVATLITRGETQEAFLLKRDLIRDALEADATLLGLSSDIYVESTDTHEDPNSQDKFAEMIIRAEVES